MRLARKEVRAQTSSARKMLTQLRTANSEIRRETSELRAKLARLERRANGGAGRSSAEEPQRRIRRPPKHLDSRLRAERTRDARRLEPHRNEHVRAGNHRIDREHPKVGAPDTYPFGL